MFAEIIVIINFVDALKCACIGCTRLQAFASVLPPVHGGERGRAFSTGLAAGVCGMSHACVEALLP